MQSRNAADVVMTVNVCVYVCVTVDTEAEQQSAGEQNTARHIATCPHGS